LLILLIPFILDSHHRINQARLAKEQLNSPPSDLPNNNSNRADLAPALVQLNSNLVSAPHRNKLRVVLARLNQLVLVEAPLLEALRLAANRLLEIPTQVPDLALQPEVFHRKLEFKIQ
jgi:hypothetical protein